MQFNFVQEDFLKLTLSLMAGAIIGAEREYNNKNAGFRTIILVTMGATLFTMLSMLIADGKDYHVVGNIVVGVGFLGAGSIFKEGATVKGLTTAATIWISAAVGMAIGAGLYALSIMAVALVILVLLGFRSVQSLIDRSNREKLYKITLGTNLTYDEIHQMLNTCQLIGKCVYQHKLNECMIYTCEVSGKETNNHKLINLLQQSKSVSEFEV